jgi:N6-L-threonylcarbamoyladenine synthase
VHHLAGHIESIFLDHGAIPLPAVVLVVSGGHTSLYLVRTPGEYRLIGRTRDDAAGEAYDKVARLLGLGYPGGPVIDRTARTGNEFGVELPRLRFTHPDRNPPPAGFTGVDLPPSLQHLADFSFSGLKTAVVRLLQQRGVSVQPGLAPAADPSPLPAEEIADICATFQRVVVETLVERTFETARWLGAASVGIAGGVSANSRLRRDALARGEHQGLPVFVPALSLSTDNAAMIAAAGLRKIERGADGSLAFNAHATLPIDA